MPASRRPDSATPARETRTARSRGPVSASRGAARRHALLEAAVRVIGRGGIAAVDHRAVAAEAGVPLGSTTYYFESKDDMVAQALHHVADRESERLEAEVLAGLLDERASIVDQLADLILGTWASERVVLIAQFELYLEAGRRADLRPVAERWDRAYRELLARALACLGTLDPIEHAHLLGAAIDGLLLQHIAKGSDRAVVRRSVIAMIERIAGGRLLREG
jgi:TetR/AcrR family transcriptional regulator, regulator of biofilm formation and stress response